MTLKNKALELQNLVTLLPEKREEKQLARIRQELEKMDEAYWVKRVKDLCVERCAYKDNPAALALWIDKKVAMFERDEIRYKGYKCILDNPKDKDKIMRQINEQLEEKDKLLESIRSIEEGMQIKLDI